MSDYADFLANYETAPRDSFKFFNIQAQCETSTPSALLDNKQHLRIQFNFYRSTNTYLMTEDARVLDMFTPPENLVTQRAIMVPLSELHSNIDEVLGTMDVPELLEQKQIIVTKVTEVAESNVAIFQVNVDVHQTTIDVRTVSKRFRYFQGSKAAVIIANLEKMRLDRLVLRNDSYATCSICKDDFDYGDGGDSEVIRLRCLHHYHELCILSWLKIKLCCPLCRYPLTFEEEREKIQHERGSYETQSQQDNNR